MLFFLCIFFDVVPFPPLFGDFVFLVYRVYANSNENMRASEFRKKAEDRLQGCRRKLVNPAQLIAASQLHVV